MAHDVEGLVHVAINAGPKVMSVCHRRMSLLPVVVRNQVGRVAYAGAVHGETVEHVEGRVVRNMDVTIKILLLSLDSER